MKKPCADLRDSRKPYAGLVSLTKACLGYLVLWNSALAELIGKSLDRPPLIFVRDSLHF